MQPFCSIQPVDAKVDPRGKKRVRNYVVEMFLNNRQEFAGIPPLELVKQLEDLAARGLNRHIRRAAAARLRRAK